METRELAKALPDIPRWIETRSLLLSGHCTILGSDPLGEGAVICATEIRLLSVIGRPRHDLVREAISISSPGWELIGQEESADWLRQALPDHPPETATLYGLGDMARLPRAIDTTRVRFLTPKDQFSLGHLPRELAAEIAGAICRTPVAARFSEGLPVSFCYAGALSETLWYVWIDTVQAYRKRGFASECASFMIRLMKHAGKNPVWGSMESNGASMQLALKLGFSPVDRVLVYSEQKGGDEA